MLLKYLTYISCFNISKLDSSVFCPFDHILRIETQWTFYHHSRLFLCVETNIVRRGRKRKPSFNINYSEKRSNKAYEIVLSAFNFQIEAKVIMKFNCHKSRIIVSMKIWLTKKIFIKTVSINVKKCFYFSLFCSTCFRWIVLNYIHTSQSTGKINMNIRAH